MQIGDYNLNFFDCLEVCQGGPQTCGISVNGQPIEGVRFDPSPLQFGETILVPMRKNGFFRSGYVLTQIDLSSGSLNVVSKVHSYMRLRMIQDNIVEFWTNAWEGETAFLKLP